MPSSNNTIFLMGIDGGSQSTKVSIFDIAGNTVAKASETLRPLNFFDDGRVEHPDDDLWESLVRACKTATQQFLEDDPDRSTSQIIAIGLCTIRCCRAVLDHKGQLVGPVMSWMDTRLGKPYQDTDSAVRYVTTSSGYVSHRLTGQFKDTASNYEGQWPIDKVTWGWSDRDATIEQFGIPREKLVELVMPAQALGKLHETAANALGLQAGTPVIATANDKAVEALGAGLNANDHNDRTALVSLGTYIGGMRTGAGLNLDAVHYFCNMSAQDKGFLYESGGIRYGMSMVSWFRDLLNISRTEPTQLVTDDDLNTQAKGISVGSDGLIVVPEFLASTDKPFQRGCILGLTAAHSAAHVFHAIMESIALTMYNRVEAMNQELNSPTDSLIVSGGGSHSDLLMQMFADIFNTPVARLKHSDAAGLGSAICAAVAVGVYETVSAAQSAMIKHERVFKPNQQRSTQYHRLNKVFRNATATTDTLLYDLHQLKQTPIDESR